MPIASSFKGMKYCGVQYHAKGLEKNNLLEFTADLGQIRSIRKRKAAVVS